MRSRILLRCSTDASRPFDYGMPYSKAMKLLGNNSGNLLFLNAIQQYLTSDEVDLDVAVFSSIDEIFPIDESYNACIINCANWIGVHNRELLRLLGEGLKNVKVPVYLIGLGAQSPTIGNYEFLDAIRDEAKSMISAVLNTGGGFGLRGGFTAEVFQRLGFHDYTVIGCPSMYQKGRDLNISNEKVAETDFKPLINGHTYSKDDVFAKMYRKYPNSEFVCQDQFYKFLYCASELTAAEKRQLLCYTDEVLWLLRNGRVRLYCDVQTWLQRIKADGFNFSFGTRIHGNFACILAGIPAFIHATDSRTQELADFFSIPHRETFDGRGNIDLYEMYTETDYSEFNRAFPTRYDEFCEFLRKHDLPLKPGRNEAYERLLSQKPKSLPSSEVDEGLRNGIDHYLGYTPAKPLFAIHSNKRFWYLISKKIKDLAPVPGQRTGA
jgi:Polysaccharide pyruvyl transferase